MTTSAGIRSLAITFPGGLKTNDYWIRKYPEMVEQAVEKKNIWSAPRADGAAEHGPWELEMMKYIEDPFRGARERRVLLPSETALTMETHVARMALEASGVAGEDIDLVMSTSLFPDLLGCGNATFIAAELGLSCAAWNLETACSGALASFETACALVRAGQYRNVLCVVSCTYSRAIEESDTMAFYSGDGAGAYVISAVPGGEGLIASSLVHTADTAGAFLFDTLEDRHRGGKKLWLKSGRGASKLIRDSSEPALRASSEAALRKAGLRISDIDWFVVNTPTMWYRDFCARVLGFDLSRSVCTFARYANCGPSLMPVNLYTAARELPIKRGDLVLIHTAGSMSSTGTAVVRWGDVRLGPLPEPPVQTF